LGEEAKGNLFRTDQLSLSSSQAELMLDEAAASRSRQQLRQLARYTFTWRCGLRCLFLRAVFYCTKLQDNHNVFNKSLREVQERRFMKTNADSAASLELSTHAADFAERVGVNQAKLNSELKPHYDFIVCGSGSSASTVARRPAENPDVSVLLLESGGSDDVPSGNSNRSMASKPWERSRLGISS
jgi:GMC oxidoreductase